MGPTMSPEMSDRIPAAIPRIALKIQVPFPAFHIEDVGTLPPWWRHELYRLSALDLHEGQTRWHKSLCVWLMEMTKPQ